MSTSEGMQHRSRFPLELPKRCIEAYGKTGDGVVVLDPFSGSGTTGIAAKDLECTYIGFEIDDSQATASRERISRHLKGQEELPGFNELPITKREKSSSGSRKSHT